MRGWGKCNTGLSRGREEGDKGGVEWLMVTALPTERCGDSWCHVVNTGWLIHQHHHAVIAEDPNTCTQKCTQYVPHAFKQNIWSMKERAHWNSYHTLKINRLEQKEMLRDAQHLSVSVLLNWSRMHLYWPLFCCLQRCKQAAPLVNPDFDHKRAVLGRVPITQTSDAWSLFCVEKMVLWANCAKWLANVPISSWERKRHMQQFTLLWKQGILWVAGFRFFQPDCYCQMFQTTLFKVK